MPAIRERTEHCDLLIGAELLAEVAESALWLRTKNDAVRVHIHDVAHVRKLPPRSEVVFVSYLLSRHVSDVWARWSKIPSTRKRFLLLTDDRPGEALSEVLPPLGVRDPQRLCLVTKSRLPDISGFLSRLVFALDRQDDERAIIHAYWEEETLVVISPLFERLRVPAELIPRVRHAIQSEREHFAIDEFGEFIYWPRHDVHMGWSQFLQAVDPLAKLRARQKSEAFNRAYGEAIRKLREESHLHQPDIKGLDERTVRRIEKGETRVTSTALAALAAAHRLSPKEYMQRLAQLLIGV